MGIFEVLCSCLSVFVLFNIGIIIFNNIRLKDWVFKSERVFWLLWIMVMLNFFSKSNFVKSFVSFKLLLISKILGIIIIFCIF